MKELDFTPLRHRLALQRRQGRRKTARWMSLLVMSMTTFSLWRLAQLGVVRADLEGLRRDHEAQTPIVGMATVVQESLETMRNRERMRDNLAGGARLHQILAELSHRLPEGVYLDAIEIQQRDRAVAEPPAPGSVSPPPAAPRDTPHLNVRIAGLADDEARVGRMVNSLLLSPVLRDVRLGYSRPGPPSAPGAREFQVRCHLPQFE